MTVPAPVLLRAVGDVGPERADPHSLFAHVRDHLGAADIAFCQLEMTLTNRGTRVPQVRHTARSSPEAAGAIQQAGFDTVSWASNHCMDWGVDGFLDTIEALERNDITVLGVGADIAAARAARIREVNGTRIAFLAYCSILPADYWATQRRPVCAPMRAHTVYEQIEPDQPGTRCRVHTFPRHDDLADLVTDVRDAAQHADVVIVSLHWGIHFVPAELADYQRIVAHAAVDAGADLILGHHAHILKPVEVYRGRGIFYSLGNFAMDLPMTPEHAARPTFRELLALHPGREPDLDSSYNFPHDSRKTVVVEAELGPDGIRRLGFRPAYISRQSVPELLNADDPRFDQVVEYLRAIDADQGIVTEYAPEGSIVFLPAAHA